MKFIPFIASIFFICLASFSSSQTVINVENYRSIYEALDACPENESCQLIIPSGTYLLDRPLVLRSRLTLTGLGSNVLLKAANPLDAHPLLVANGSTESIGPIKNDESADSFDIELTTRRSVPRDTMIKIGAGELSQEGLSETSVTDESLSNKLRLSKRLSIAFPANTEVEIVRPIRGVRVENLSLEGNDTWVVSMHGTRDVSFSGVQFSGQWGIWMTTGLGVSIQDCDIKPRVYGLRWVSMQSSTLENNRMVDVWGPNFGLMYCHRCKLIDNFVKTSQLQLEFNYSGDGLSLSNSSDNLIFSNTFDSVSCYGIWLSHGASRNHLTRNRISSSLTSGVRIEDGTGNRLIKNFFSSIENSAAIYLASPRQSLLDANEMLNCYTALTMEQPTGTIATSNSSIDHIVDVIAPNDDRGDGTFFAENNW